MFRTKRWHIFFRVDGNSQIGLGHIYRSLALASFVCNEYDITFILKDNLTPVSIRPIIEYNQIIIPKNIHLQDEPRYLAEILKDSHMMITLDGYNFNDQYLNDLEKHGAPIIFIDDQIKLNFSPCSLIINHAGGIDKEKYKSSPHAQLLLGPKYTIIKSIFFKNSSLPKVKDPNIFICFGGADPKDKTNFTIKEIINKKVSYQVINIVVGQAYDKMNELKELCIDLKNIKIHKNLSQDKLSKLMEISHIGITSPSTTSYEFSASSLGQLFLIKTAENQENIFKYLIENGFAKVFEEISTSEITNKKSRLIDGKSPGRIRLALDKIKETRL